MALEHPIPDPILTRIGDVTVSFALLESTFRTIATVLFRDTQQVADAATAELSFRNLRAVVSSLYRVRYRADEDFAALRALSKLAAELEKQRNDMTHSIWAAGSGDDEAVTRIKTTAKEKKGVLFTFEIVDVEALTKLALQITTLAEEVQAFGIGIADGTIGTMRDDQS